MNLNSIQFCNDHPGNSPPLDLLSELGNDLINGNDAGLGDYMVFLFLALGSTIFRMLFRWGLYSGIA